MQLKSGALLACSIAAALHPFAARADAAGDTRLREALRTATTQLHALEDERAAWQVRETSLQKELETLRAQLKAVGSSKASDHNVAELKRRIADQADATTKLSESLAQCQAAAQDGTEAARASEDARARLSAETTALAGRLAASEARNDRLYRVGKDIIDWLSRVGVGGALAAREPFLGLKRVQLENIAQGYEDKLLEQKARPGGNPP